MLAKNQLYTAEITGLTSEGSGVCRVEEMAVFVPGTAVGDLIELRIVKVMSSYAFGIVEKILIEEGLACIHRTKYMITHTT